jgi:hypothetical protein
LVILVVIWVGSAYGLIHLVARVWSPPPLPEPEAPLTEVDESPPIDPEISEEYGLAKLTIGLAAAEVSELLGPALYNNQLPQSEEEWRYPLGTVDENGIPSEGVLVLSFQRGRLVRKALEQDVRVVPEAAERPKG